MKHIKYLIQFICIIFLFIVFKILGLKISRTLSSFIFNKVGPFFRSKNISLNNLSIAFPELNENQKKQIINEMWTNYGKIFAEYIFIKDFRNSKKFSNKIIVENQEILEKIKLQNKPVIFISGHFNNFELMAMHIEKSGIDLAAIYRPLNNKFLNPIMEVIRKKYICKKQIKKGISGTKKLLKNFKDGTSVALMIDQRVSEGIECDFFRKKALTTSIPAQFIKKFNASVVPIYIERLKGDYFKLKILDNIQFSENDSVNKITLDLNQILEKMIESNPEQWIWTHNRWKI
ncbi:lysophospholipid acyltransferase family protein [Pelagibacterales bacterium SAG-MED13]|nr:lysophospholipid acyltransferase family protein [Pelagibacterales bacterium SAG-MED13]|tara:strand:- start:133 stop:999 length:867 start_codon:yes stop_codon:yes gene_type:complete